MIGQPIFYATTSNRTEAAVDDWSIGSKAPAA